MLNILLTFWWFKVFFWLINVLYSFPSVVKFFSCFRLWTITLIWENTFFPWWFVLKYCSCPQLRHYFQQPPRCSLWSLKASHPADVVEGLACHSLQRWVAQSFLGGTIPLEREHLRDLNSKFYKIVIWPLEDSWCTIRIQKWRTFGMKIEM